MGFEAVRVGALVKVVGVAVGGGTRALAVVGGEGAWWLSDRQDTA